MAFDVSRRGASNPGLTLDSVHFGYETDRTVIRGLSASLDAGRLCALIGPNAAGKTTLLRLMLGQLTPESGAVYLGGESVFCLRPERRGRSVSYVPQSGGGRFAFTVKQVVAMGRHVHRFDPDAVEQALRRCDLDAVRDRLYPELSAGQQQRVRLARALAQAHGEGQVMLLDEPASAMDLWHVHHTMHLLKEEAGRGLVVLTVMHDLDLAARYADEVWLLNDGRLEASGSWDQVMVPEVLEPAYGVRLRLIQAEGIDRPMFRVDLPGRL